MGEPSTAATGDERVEVFLSEEQGSSGPTASSDQPPTSYRHADAAGVACDCHCYDVIASCDVSMAEDKGLIGIQNQSVCAAAIAIVHRASPSVAVCVRETAIAHEQRTVSDHGRGEGGNCRRSFDAGRADIRNG